MKLVTRAENDLHTKHQQSHRVSTSITVLNEYINHFCMMID